MLYSRPLPQADKLRKKTMMTSQNKFSYV